MQVPQIDAITPITPYPQPIDAITTPATSGDTVLVCINKEWLPFIRNLLWVGTERLTWKGTENDIQIAMYEAHELMAALNDCACDCIADCIANSPTVIQNIEYTQTGNPYEPLPPEELARNLLDGIETCELDRIYAACEYCIDAIFDATHEVFQRINAVTSPYKQIGELVKGIPIIGGIGNLAEVAFWVTEYGGTVFIAADSESVRFNLSCQLFCKASIDCELTLNMIQEVFDANAISGMPSYLDVFEFVGWLIDNVLGGDPALATATSIAQLGLMVIKHGGKLGEFAFGVVSLEQTILIGSQNPTTEYLACAACSDVAIVRFNDPNDATYELYSSSDLPILPTIQLTGGNPDAYVKNSQQYDPIYDGTYYESTIRIDLGAEHSIESVRFDWRYGGANRAVGRRVFFEDNNGNYLDNIGVVGTSNADIWHTQQWLGLVQPGVRYLIINVWNATKATPPPAYTLGLDNCIVIYT